MSIFGDNFEMWKLHTVWDYLSFFAYILIGIFLLTLLSRYMTRQRNQEAAVKRTMQRLKRLAGPKAKLFRDVTLKLPEGEQKLDGLLADKSGIYLIRVYGWGTKIFGSLESENWRREDNKRKEEFPNPLLELKKGVAGIQAVLEAQGVKGVKIMPMIVFADNFQTPELYIGYGSCSTTFQEMKSWYKKQAGVKKEQYDMARVSSILEGLILGTVSVPEKLIQETDSAAEPAVHDKNEEG